MHRMNGFWMDWALGSQYASLYVLFLGKIDVFSQSVGKDILAAERSDICRARVEAEKFMTEKKKQKKTIMI